MSASTRKNLGIASLVLGLAAWLGEKFGLITKQVSDWVNGMSLVVGAIATFA